MLRMIEELEKIVGKDNVISDNELMESYSHDETPGFKTVPKAVVKPETPTQISEIMKLANTEKFSVTPRGGGTGLSGGAIPCENGIVVSFERLNRIKEIDVKNLMSVVEPGVITGDLAREVSRYGLLYPPDPASIDSCTIGGNIAHCAGGARTVKYGTTRDYVVGLEAVIPNGDIIRCGGKLVKNVTGYSLTNLLIGSEGTLAIITEAILKLLPMPGAKVSLLVPYSDLEQAIQTVQEILTHKIIPSAIELMEGRAIKLVEEYLGRRLPFNIEGATYCLLIEIDGKRKEEVESDYEEIGEIALKNAAIDVLVAEDRLQQDKLWEARRTISDALKSKSEVAHEDVVVPKDKISTLVRGIKELETKYQLKIVCYGHIGDGNVHVNVLRETIKEEEWKAKLSNLIKELFDLTLSLGGMLSGEHGIGLAKKPYLSMALSSQQIELMRQIKSVFDPNNILNPGKIFQI